VAVRGEWRAEPAQIPPSALFEPPPQSMFTTRPAATPARGNIQKRSVKVDVDGCAGDHRLHGIPRYCPQAPLPLCHDSPQRLLIRVAGADLADGIAGVAGAQPDQGLADARRPVFEAAKWHDLHPLAADVPGTQDCQRGDNEPAASGADDPDRLDVEAPQLRPLAAGVEGAHECAADEIAGDDEVVAGREEAGVGWRLDRLAEAQQPDIELALREGLAQE